MSGGQEATDSGSSWFRKSIALQHDCLRSGHADLPLTRAETGTIAPSVLSPVHASGWTSGSHLLGRFCEQQPCGKIL